MFGDQGFSLVELMFVVLVIGILVVVAIPVFNAQRVTAESHSCFSNQRMIEGAFQDCYATTGNRPPSGLVDNAHLLITGGYIKRAPTCPVSGADYSIDTSGFITSASLICGHGHY